MSEFRRRGGWWVAAQVGLLAGFIAALRLRRDLPDAVAVAGWSIAIAGAAMALAGLLTLGPSLTPYPEPLEQGRLVERGIYRLVRHPIYGGIGVAALGFAVGQGSVLAALVALVLVVFFRVKAYGEEQRLLAAYPGYAAYRSRVRRALVPWLL